MTNPSLSARITCCIVLIALYLLPGSPAHAGFLPNIETDTQAAVDSAGNVYLVGTSDAAWGMPVRAFQGGSDAYVVKLDAAGVLQWVTFLGSAAEDQGQAIAVEPGGSAIYVTGTSRAAWGTTIPRGYTDWNDAFVAKLNGSGVLQWLTFLGGPGDDYGYGLTLGGGALYLTGKSSATWGTSPTRAYSALFDAFVAKVNSSGVLEWNTFLGGTGIDEGAGIAADGNGNAYVVGSSTDAWGTGPVQAFTTGWDAFAAKLDTNGALQFLTFLGGAGHDRGLGIAVDTAGSTLYAVGGSTGTWGTGPQRPYTAWWDGFAAKLNGSGVLQWNTFLGSGWCDVSTGVTLDGSGNVFVSGSGDAAWGTNPARAYNAGYDAHLVKLSPSDGAVQVLAFVGGEGDDFGSGLAVDGSGNPVLAGVNDIVWGNPLQSFGDAPNGFALKLNGSGTLQWNAFFGGTPWLLDLPLIIR